MAGVDSVKDYYMIFEGKDVETPQTIEISKIDESKAADRVALYALMLNKIKGNRTWAQVAEDSGVSEAAISRLRNPDGKYKLTEKMAEKLARGSDSGVTASQLFNASRGKHLIECDSAEYGTVCSAVGDSFARNNTLFRASGIEKILFKGAVTEWMKVKYGYGFSMCNPTDSSIKDIEFDEKATDGVSEFLFRYIYIDPEKEESVYDTLMVINDNQKWENAVEMAYNISFCQGIVQPLIFSEPDKCRKIYVVTNSERLYKKICERGCRSFYGNLTVLFLFRESGTIAEENVLSVIN